VEDERWSGDFFCPDVIRTLCYSARLHRIVLALHYGAAGDRGLDLTRPDLTRLLLDGVRSPSHSTAVTTSTSNSYRQSDQTNPVPMPITPVLSSLRAQLLHIVKSSHVQIESSIDALPIQSSSSLPVRVTPSPSKQSSRVTPSPCKSKPTNSLYA
jgi:hypothetical protein